MKRALELQDSLFDVVTDLGEARKDSDQSSLAGKRVLIIVENLPVPFDRRVWQEACALRDAGVTISIIAPAAPGFEQRYEFRDGIHIHRHPLPRDARTALGYLAEYGTALFWQTVLSWKVFFTTGFDILQVCNPPDLGFLIALQFKPFGRPYIFDHHDITPELFEAKYGRRGFLWKLVTIAERINFRIADVVISTNTSYRDLAIDRGRKAPDDVFIVRSGPDTTRLQPIRESEEWKKGRRHLVGYVGVMGEQEGIELLLEAAAHIVFREGRQDIGFCLVGGGSHLSDLIALRDRMNLGEYVTFTGRIPDEEMFSVLATADVCVNPDRVTPMNSLSTMNKVLEYMALGKSQVQFDVREGRYSAGESSLYADANDPEDFARKILDLIDHPELRAKMGAAGRLRYSSVLSWERQKPHLRAAHQRALNIARQTRLFR